MPTCGKVQGWGEALLRAPTPGQRSGIIEGARPLPTASVPWRVVTGQYIIWQIAAFDVKMKYRFRTWRLSAHKLCPQPR